MVDEKRAGRLPDLSSLRIDPRTRANDRGGKKMRLGIGVVLAVVVLLLGVRFFMAGSPQEEVAGHIMNTAINTSLC